MTPPTPGGGRVVFSRGPAATRRIGERLARLLRHGDVVALEGALGAGKTELVRGIALGLGIDDPEAVCSPSFQIMRPYRGRIAIYHVDGYRLGGEEEIRELGLLEPLQGPGVWLVEWAQRIEGLLEPDRLTITMTITGRLTRRLSLHAGGRSWRRRLATFDAGKHPGPARRTPRPGASPRRTRGRRGGCGGGDPRRGGPGGGESLTIGGSRRP